MIADLVIHLGDRKSGSTSIQHALAGKTLVCDTVSLLYPTKINHTPLAKFLTTKSQFQFCEKRFGLLAKRLATANEDVAVISAEDFESADPKTTQATFAK